MKYQSLLERPISKACGSVVARWENLRGPRGLAAASVGKDRDAIIAIQWLVAIGNSYLVFAFNSSVTDPLPVLLILISLVSAPVVQRIPAGMFEKRLIEPGLLILNSILIVSAMTLSEQTPRDLLLLFFLCVFIAAIGENLLQISIGCFLLSLVFLMFISPNAVDVSAIDSNSLIRVPFMFGISIFYGYMTNQVKREKKRVEKMQETMRLKRQFVSALAHDIKTPLNVILGHAELLAGAYCGAQEPTERKTSLKCIRENIDRIVQHITDFLAVSKLETLKLESARNPVQMNAIAADVVLQQMVTAREKQLNLTVKLDNDLKPVLGDDDQLRRVLWNLVGNAIKFTPRGGSITVTSRMGKKDVSMAVTNTGPGIPEEEVPGLFSEFKRLKGSANTEGTGLGLFIVKTIVEGHGGTVAVESKNGGGTTFIILLPASNESGAMRPNSAGNESEMGTWVGRCA